MVDEGVQIHGGYGFHQDYAVERAYRDSRINRIFEGTNEINRLLATGMLLKRAQRGQLPLVEAVKKLQAEILAGPSLAAGSGDEDSQAGREREEGRAVRAGRRLSEVSWPTLEEQQEVLAGITDISMNAFAMESALLRTQKLAQHHKGEIAADMCRGVLARGDGDHRERGAQRAGGLLRGRRAAHEPGGAEALHQVRTGGRHRARAAVSPSRLLQPPIRYGRLKSSSPLASRLRQVDLPRRAGT